jgi:hypothetical protein
MTDSELVLSYLVKAKGLQYTREDNMFILWKLNGHILEIHDIYSKEGPGKMLKFALDFVESIDCKIVEGYIDKDYADKDRSHDILINFGMRPYKETEEYVYYRMNK